MWGVKKRKYFITWKPGQHLIYVSRRKEICFDMWGLRVGAESTQRGPVKHVEISNRKVGGEGRGNKILEKKKRKKAEIWL